MLAEDRSPEGLGLTLPEPVLSRDAEVRLSADGRRALSWPADSTVAGQVLVWDLEGRQIIARIPRDAGFIRAELARNNELVAVINQGWMGIWDALTAQQVSAMPTRTAADPVFIRSPDQRYLLLEAPQGQEPGITGQVWDLQVMEQLGSRQFGGSVRLLGLGAGGDIIASGDDDRFVRLWSLEEKRLIAELPHGAAPRGVQFSGDGRWLASDDVAGVLRLWSLADTSLPVYQRTARTGWRFTFDADSSWFGAGSPAADYQIISLDDRRSVVAGFRHLDQQAMNSFDAFPLGLMPRWNTVVTFHGDDGARVWRLPDNDAGPPEDAMPRIAAAAARLSRDGQRVAVGNEAGNILLPMSSVTQSVAIPALNQPGFIGHSLAVSCMDFSADGRRLISGALDGSVRVWDLVSGAPEPDLRRLHSTAVNASVFLDEQGQRVATASRDQVLVSDTETGQVLAELRVQAAQPGLAVAGDNLLVAGDRGGVVVWSPDTGAVVRYFPASGNPVSTALPLLETGLMVLASQTGELELNYIETGETVGNKMKRVREAMSRTLGRIGTA